jgi:hypothetical protein
MKRSLFILVAMIAFFATEAQARFRIPVGEHQKIVKVATLPDEYQNDNDVHVDLGCMYTVFEIAYIPIWTVDKGEIVCFTEKEKDTYYIIDPETLSSIKTDLKIDDLNSLISIPFWDAWGGKIIVILIILLIVIYRKGKKKMKEQTQNTEAHS